MKPAMKKGRAKDNVSILEQWLKSIQPEAGHEDTHVEFPGYDAYCPSYLSGDTKDQDAHSEGKWEAGTMSSTR